MSPSPNPERNLSSLPVPIGGPAEYTEVDAEVREDAPPEPPRARSAPRVHTVHGESRIDEYFWLRNREDPDVLAHLDAENRYTDRVMRHTDGLQERLYQELRGRIKESDLSVPTREDGWLYYTRTEAGAQYPIFCRRRDEPDAPEETLLDVNQLAAGHAYFRMGAFEVSPDHRLLAYSADTTGAESFTHLREGSRHRRPVPRDDRGRVARRGVGQRLAHPVLHPAGRRAPAQPALPPRRGREPDRRPAGPPRARRRLLPRHPSHPQPPVPDPRAGEPLDQRGALPQRRRAGGRVPRGRAASSRDRVLGHAPRRAVLHRHQRRGAELPAGRRAGVQPRARALGAGAALSPGGEARRGGGVRAIPAAVGAE